MYKTLIWKALSINSKARWCSITPCGKGVVRSISSKSSAIVSRLSRQLVDCRLIDVLPIFSFARGRINDFIPVFFSEPPLVFAPLVIRPIGRRHTLAPKVQKLLSG